MQAYYSQITPSFMNHKKHNQFHKIHDGNVMTLHTKIHQILFFIILFKEVVILIKVIYILQINVP